MGLLESRDEYFGIPDIHFILAISHNDVLSMWKNQTACYTYVPPVAAQAGGVQVGLGPRLSFTHRYKINLVTIL